MSPALDYRTAFDLAPIGLVLSRQRQIVDAQARQDRQRHARPDTGNLDQQAEGVAFSGGQEAKQDLRIFSDHEMCKQADALADGR